jgi:hypothetical protein
MSAGRAHLIFTNHVPASLSASRAAAPLVAVHSFDFLDQNVTWKHPLQILAQKSLGLVILVAPDW